MRMCDGSWELNPATTLYCQSDGWGTVTMTKDGSPAWGRGYSKRGDDSRKGGRRA